jgi:hypothetical protein
MNPDAEVLAGYTAGQEGIDFEVDPDQAGGE